VAQPIGLATKLGMPLNGGLSADERQMSASGK
jgi:hypothetical protein